MDLSAISEAVIQGNIEKAKDLTQQAVESGGDPQALLDQGLISAMDTVGEQFAKGLLFVPQMLRSAKTMQECLAILQPHFQADSVTSKGKVVMGTVKGDLHDIGKNLVAMMLEGAGFHVVDLGVDVSPEDFVKAVSEERPHIVGMSALLSTTMPAMSDTVRALSEAGLRDAVQIMIGGAPVTAQFAEEIGADRYAPDAGSAVGEAKKLMASG
jgi:5-methyltetrahydrofolate--homocysteine methyltransferase